MKNLIILILILISNLSFGQDPNCHYNIILKKIQTEKYEYCIFLEQNFTQKPNFDLYIEKCKYEGLPNNNHITKSNNGKKNILSHKFWTHCYPNPKKIEFRAVITRKNKKTNKIDLMYTEASVEEGQTEVIFKKFKSGKQKAKVNRFFSFVNI